MMRSGTLTVRIWNRSDVQVSSPQPVSARSFRPEAVAQALTRPIPIFATTVLTPDGTIVLPPEEFALPALTAAPHAGIFIQAVDANVLVMLPAGTALLLGNVQRGLIDVQDYRNGAFALLVHNGGARLHNVGGTGFVQVARGQIMTDGSSFDRFRARTAIGNILFENVMSRQIDVSSYNGTIVYDNGGFQPGLARFESTNGNVGIGVGAGNVQIGAHSSVGRIYSTFGGGAVRAGQTDAQLGGNGSVVTASSSHGAVYLYNGALRAQRRLPAEWAPMTGFIRRPAPNQPARGRRIH